MLFLARPSAKYKASYVDALGEFHAEGRDLHSSEQWVGSNFNLLVQSLLAEAQTPTGAFGNVPVSHFWLIHRADDAAGRETYLGRTTIRHELDRYLLHLGGHIGYATRPSARKCGYGTAILRLVLPEARNLGFGRVLVTCDSDNVGSRRIIERSGGVLENAVPYRDFGRSFVKLRFWIRL